MKGDGPWIGAPTIFRAAGLLFGVVPFSSCASEPTVKAIDAHAGSIILCESEYRLSLICSWSCGVVAAVGISGNG